MKLLIADDDQVSRTALKEIMALSSEWEIFEVDDGQDALDVLCDGFKADLCIFDIKMPRVDGVELLQRIRRDRHLKSLKVVMTSASRDRETIVTLARLQISGYLLKPYDAAKTKAVLQPLIPKTTDPILASRNLLTRTLLVVDDDPVMQEAMNDFVRETGRWEVLTANSAKEALGKLRAGLRPDLILSDLRMPEVDGVGFLQEIRADRHLENLRVAMLSGDQDREKLVALAQLKIYGYLLKPCTLPKLKELFARVESED